MGCPAYKLIDLNPIELFTAQYLSHYLLNSVAPFHRQWYSALNDRSKRYVAIEAMRGSGKTTLGSVIFSLFALCEGKDPEFHVMSRSGGSTGTSTQIMSRVKRELEHNDLLIHDYGLKRGSKWLEDHIQIVRPDGSTVDFYSRGKRASIRGARGTVLIDDPQNADDCRSETVLQRDEEWFFTDVLPVLLGDQRLIFIGTPISPLSLLSKVKELPGWTVLSSPAEDPPHSGRSSWPEQYSNEDLAQRKAMMGLDLYAAEYLCEPRVSGNPVFRPEWVQDYDPDTVAFQRLKAQGGLIVTGMDCAESKSDQADNTALMTLFVPFEGKGDVYLLDARAGHWSTKEGAEQLFLVFDKCKQHKSVVESRVSDKRGGDAMIEEIRERERIYSKYVNLYAIKPNKDKVTRAMSVQSIVQEGRLHIDKRNKEHQALLSELTMFTGDQNFHDDRVDALVHALGEVRERSHTSTQPIKSALEGSW